jgi:hypothetical protein
MTVTDNLDLGSANVKASDCNRQQAQKIRTYPFQGAFETKIPSIVQVKTYVPQYMRPPIHAVLSISFMDSPGSLVRIVASLRAGRSAVRIPVALRDFYLLQNVHTNCGTNPVFHSMGTRVFPGV